MEHFVSHHIELADCRIGGITAAFKHEASVLALAKQLKIPGKDCHSGEKMFMLTVCEHKHLFPPFIHLYHVSCLSNVTHLSNHKNFRLIPVELSCKHGLKTSTM